MRRTRNQRRRDLFETVATLIAIVLLIASIALATHLWIEIDRRSETLPEIYANMVPVIPMPEGWSEDDPEWIAALQRFDREQEQLYLQSIMRGGR